MILEKGFIMKMILAILTIVNLGVSQIDTTCCKTVRIRMYSHSDFTSDQIWIEKIKWMWERKNEYSIKNLDDIIINYPKNKFFITQLASKWY